MEQGISRGGQISIFFSRPTFSMAKLWDKNKSVNFFDLNQFVMSDYGKNPYRCDTVVLTMYYRFSDVIPMFWRCTTVLSDVIPLSWRCPDDVLPFLAMWYRCPDDVLTMYYRS